MARRLMFVLRRFACEIERKLSRPAKADGPAKAGHYVLLFVVLLLVAPPLAFAQPEQPPTTAGETRASETQATPEAPAAGEAQEVEHAEGAEHAEGLHDRVEVKAG